MITSAGPLVHPFLLASFNSSLYWALSLKSTAVQSTLNVWKTLSQNNRIYFLCVFLWVNLRVSGVERDRTVLSEQNLIFDLCTNIKKTRCLSNCSQDPLLIWGETLAAPHIMKEYTQPDDETTSPQHLKFLNKKFFFYSSE